MAPSLVGNRLMVVTLKNLTVAYDGHPAIHHLNGVFAGGSLTAIIGPNGAGKSTLIKALAGLTQPSEGMIDRGDLQAGEIAYLPQIHELDKSFAISILDLVMMGCIEKAGMFQGFGPDMIAAAENALATVGLEGFADRALNTLSAGQFQRALFARTIIQDAKLILLDEPFNAVDGKTVGDLLNIIRGWHQQGKTVIAVLHDMRQVRENFPEALLLARQCIGWGNTDKVLTEANMAKAMSMSENWDEEAAICEVSTA